MARSPAAGLPLSDAEAAPITINQERRLAFEEVLSADGRTFLPFHVTLPIDIQGALNVPAFEEALRVLVSTHGALRVAFRPAAGTSREGRLEHARRFLQTGVFDPEQYCQEIHPATRVTLDLRAPVASDSVDAIVREEAAKPFEYDRPPLMRPLLLRLSDTHHVFVAVMHHLICDMVSLNILKRDLESAYRHCAHGVGESVAADRGAYQRAMRRVRHQLLEGPDGARAARYWMDRWAEYGDAQLHRGDFTFALPVIRGADYGVASEVLDLEPHVLHRIHAYARRVRVTPHVVCLAAFAMLLEWCTGRDQVAIWGNFGVRTTLECRDVPAWLVHSHMLGIDVQAHPAGLPLLHHVKSVVVDAINHCGMPLAELWRRLGECPETGLRFFFDLIDVPDDEPERSDCDVRMHRIRSHRASQHAGDFELLVIARSGGLRFLASYHRSLFVPMAVRQLLQRYALFLQEMIASS